MDMYRESQREPDRDGVITECGSTLIFLIRLRGELTDIVTAVR